VFLTSRWFPIILAISQAARYVAFLGYDYWAAARYTRHFDAVRFIRRDLARPLFEPSGFCGAWTDYGFGQSATLGLDLPAYVAATLFHSLVNWEVACFDTLTTPRGQIIVALFVLPAWFLVGLSMRRMAKHRWRRRATGRVSRMIVGLGLIPLPIGLLALGVGIVGIFVSEAGVVVRMAGTAFWIITLGLLSAERLGVWPFASNGKSPESANVRPQGDLGKTGPA
jgi:hypothetical protein